MVTGRSTAAHAVDAIEPVAATPRPARLLPLVALVAALYLLTATWAQPYNIDAFTNAVQARSFAAGDGIALPEYDEYTAPEYGGRLLWVVPSPSGTTSQYPPGAAAWGALFYLIDTSHDVETVVTELESGPAEIDLHVPSLVPAALASAAAALAAMAFLGLLFRDVLPGHAWRAAFLAAALGTGAWSVAADKLWQHGPAMMCIAAALYAASRDRFVLSGLAFGAAILVRPHIALIAAAVGLVVAWRRRDIRPAIALGSTSLLGLAGLLAYNDLVWGEPSVSGGYTSYFTDNLTTFTPLRLLGRLAGFFVDPGVGVLVFSPFLIVALLGLPSAIRRAPDWAVGAAVGGAAYLVVQFQANRLSGGEGFFGYRYPLEALTAAAPLLAIAAFAWIGQDEGRRRIALGFLAVSIAIHAAGAQTFI